MKRPYVVCHMMGTVDGRIQTERWNLSVPAEAQYEAVHALHRADAWLCGTRTFQVDFLEQKGKAAFPHRGAVPAGDFLPEVHALKPRKLRSAKLIYAVAVDAKGKLRWESNDMRGDRLVVLTTRRAPLGYLSDLRSKSIPYLVCGDTEISFSEALTKLHRHFGIKKVMLEGGGRLNGTLLAEGLIDELSLLICPFADGSRDLPTVFDTPKAAVAKQATPLRLKSLSKRPGGVVWLRYLA